MNMFPTKTFKTIGPLGKPEGNITHIVQCAISLEIALWVVAMLKCLQSRNVWGYGSVLFLLHVFIMLFIQIFLGFIHLLGPCMHSNTSSLTIHS
jgi:hypothetical protein